MKAAAGIGMIALLGVASCGKADLLWSESKSFEGGEWKHDDRVYFIPDTAAFERDPRLLVWTIRYGENASVESFPMVVETDNPEKTSIDRDTVTVRLLPRRERTAARGSLGLFEVSDTTELPSGLPPGWSAVFYPVKEESEMKGIYSITIDLEK